MLVEPESSPFRSIRVTRSREPRGAGYRAASAPEKHALSIRIKPSLRANAVVAVAGGVVLFALYPSLERLAVVALIVSLGLGVLVAVRGVVHTITIDDRLVATMEWFGSRRKTHLDVPRGAVRDLAYDRPSRSSTYVLVATLANGDRKVIANLVEGQEVAEYVVAQIRAELGLDRPRRAPRA